MPRPQRYRDRESGIAAGGAQPAPLAEPRTLPGADDMSVEAKVAPKTRKRGTVSVVPPPLDEPTESGQSSRSGLVAEGELELSRAVARKMGWVPKEEWKRDPAKWVEADQYLENVPKELERAKTTLRRTGQMTEAAIEEARKASLAQAEANLRAAVKAGNEEQVVEAAKAVGTAAAPPPTVAAWIEARPWFSSDPVARALAIRVTNEAAAQGKPVAEQLALADARVRKAFPEFFDDMSDPEPPPEPEPSARGERPLSDTRRAAPDTREGNRTADTRAPRSKEPGWDQMPSIAREQMRKTIARMGAVHGIPEQQAKERLARAYWQNVGGQ